MTNQGYIAAILTPDSADALREIAIHPHLHCHHLTLAYRPDEVAWHRFGSLVGTRVRLRAIAHAWDLRGQAVVVSGIESCNAVPHITVSCAAGTKPVYSNELLARVCVRDQYEGAECIDLELEAYVEFVPFI